jgi:NADH-quinone oxidoreductase subunit H
MGCFNVLLKGVVGVAVMIWIRWTFPRLRIDQVITTCLKYCTPIAAVMFLGVAFWQVWFQPRYLPGNAFFGLLNAPAHSKAVDEGWPAETDEALKTADSENGTQYPVHRTPNSVPSTQFSASDSPDRVAALPVSPPTDGGQ